MCNLDDGNDQSFVEDFIENTIPALAKNTIIP